jgi:GAF domain-containing protein
MQTWDAIKNWFVKVFTETSEIEKNTEANLRALRNITASIYVATILMGIFTFLQGLYIQAAVVGVLWILLNISGALLVRGTTFPARFLSPLAILITIAVIATRANGLHDTSIILFVVVIIFASLTLGVKGALIFGALSGITVTIIAILEITGVVVNRYSDLTDLTDIIIIGILAPSITTIIQIALLSRLNQSLGLAQKSSAEQKLINTELIRLQQNLEQIIATRTQELETQSSLLEQQAKSSQRRARQFQTIVDVARFVANIRDLDTLFETVTKLISDKMGYYHVGIFLNDEASNYAILVATNSEGGEVMLNRNHRLKIGEIGIVGNVAYTGSARVALDTGDDAIYFNNPDLPETRSEMAVALKVGNQIVGVLDIQSRDSNAFSQEDIEAFSALADQVAIAIENVRLYENTQKSLTEAETIYRQYLRSEWGRLPTRTDLAGFQYKITGATPLEKPIYKPEFEQVMQSGDLQVHQDERDGSSLVVPIKLRGEVLGIINIRQPGNKTWSKDEIELVQSVTERMAISTENARLLQDSQERAVKEKIISEIASKISASINLSGIMQTAVEELGHTISGTEVKIRLKKSS